MKRRNRGPRGPAPSFEALLLAAARNAPPPSDHAGDDDCPLCRMTAGQEPIDVITLPDGTVIEVHEVPVPGTSGTAS